jgi:hypothetical protein
MPRHASNSDRIARAAAEAAAKTDETAKKKATRAATPRAPRAPRARASGPKAKGRIKIIWAVGKPGLEPVKTFPYIERAAADAESAKRGTDFRVVPLKVPME